MRIILASASPRRRELFAKYNLPFETAISGADEDNISKNCHPKQYAMRAAELKAHHCVAEYKNGIIISADTIVFLGRTIFGKPKNDSDALKMLMTLSGKAHCVATGLCLLRIKNGEVVHKIIDVEVTKVTFITYNEQTALDYIQTGEPFDKAGAYGIQGSGALLVKKIDGCYYNVVGLPLVRLKRNLIRAGIDTL